MCFVCLVGAHDFSRSKSVLYVFLNPLKDIAFCKSSHNGKTSGKNTWNLKKGCSTKKHDPNEGISVQPGSIFKSTFQKAYGLDHKYDMMIV